MTFSINPFNSGQIKSEAPTPELRQEKIEEMAKRGLVVKRLYQYEKTRIEPMSKGKHRTMSDYSQVKYGAVFERAKSSVDSIN